MNESVQKVNEIIFADDLETALADILKIVTQFAGNFESERFARMYEDIKRLFDGRYPGYRASNTKYHDFAHTVSVTLATARLMHGCHIDGHRFSGRESFLTLAAALFHDVA